MIWAFIGLLLAFIIGGCLIGGTVLDWLDSFDELLLQEDWRIDD